jgi:hypothetical protein
MRRLRRRLSLLPGFPQDQDTGKAEKIMAVFPDGFVDDYLFTLDLLGRRCKRRHDGVLVIALPRARRRLAGLGRQSNHFGGMPYVPDARWRLAELQCIWRRTLLATTSSTCVRSHSMGARRGGIPYPFTPRGGLSPAPLTDQESQRTESTTRPTWGLGDRGIKAFNPTKRGRTRLTRSSARHDHAWLEF